MTFTTIHGKALRPMIRTFRLVVRLEMAAHTFRRQRLPIELSNGSRRVACITIHNRMRTDQRETVLMLVDVVDRHSPAVGVVTQVALGTVFASMNVGVAILALLAGIRENRIDVALLTGNFGMEATQRKCCFAMIKLRPRTQRKPAFAGMAVLTRNLQRPMRISVRRRDAGIFLANGGAQEQEQEQEPDYTPGFKSPGQNFLFGSFGLSDLRELHSTGWRIHLSQVGVIVAGYGVVTTA
jgi:hypothetical protein